MTALRSPFNYRVWSSKGNLLCFVRCFVYDLELTECLFIESEKYLFKKAAALNLTRFHQHYNWHLGEDLLKLLYSNCQRAS